MSVQLRSDLIAVSGVEGGLGDHDETCKDRGRGTRMCMRRDVVQ